MKLLQMLAFIMLVNPTNAAHALSYTYTGSHFDHTFETSSRIGTYTRSSRTSNYKEVYEYLNINVAAARHFNTVNNDLQDGAFNNNTCISTRCNGDNSAGDNSRAASFNQFIQENGNYGWEISSTQSVTNRVEFLTRAVSQSTADDPDKLFYNQYQYDSPIRYNTNITDHVTAFIRSFFGGAAFPDRNMIVTKGFTSDQVALAYRRDWNLSSSQNPYLFDEPNITYTRDDDNTRDDDSSSSYVSRDRGPSSGSSGVDYSNFRTKGTLWSTDSASRGCSIDNVQFCGIFIQRKTIYKEMTPGVNVAEVIHDGQVVRTSQLSNDFWGPMEVPEPSTIAIFIFALVGLSLHRARRQRKF